MYEELVKQLREYANEYEHGTPTGDTFYDAAVAINDLQADNKEMLHELEDAAKRIRELQEEVEEQKQIAAHYELSAKDWWIEACDYKAQMPHWVSVEERLPEPGEYVLAWEWRGFCIVDRYICMDDGGWGLSNDGAIYTHWMPLPEPPQEVQE